MRLHVSRRWVVAMGGLAPVLGAAHPMRVLAQINRRDPDTAGAVTPADIDRRLEQRAADLKLMAPQGADRYVLFDTAYPHDQETYRAVGKCALLLIVAISKRAEELPLRRVYTRIADRDIDLRMLGARRSETAPRSSARAMFGPYRFDAFYLAPLGALLRESLLLADFARNRTGFFINRAPLSPPDFIRDDAERDVAGTAQDAAVRAFAAREFPGFDLVTN